MYGDAATLEYGDAEEILECSSDSDSEEEKLSADVLIETTALDSNTIALASAPPHVSTISCEETQTLPHVGSAVLPQNTADDTEHVDFEHQSSEEEGEVSDQEPGELVRETGLGNHNSDAVSTRYAGTTSSGGSPDDVFYSTDEESDDRNTSRKRSRSGIENAPCRSEERTRVFLRQEHSEHHVSHYDAADARAGDQTREGCSTDNSTKVGCENLTGKRGRETLAEEGGVSNGTRGGPAVQKKQVVHRPLAFKKDSDFLGLTNEVIARRHAAALARYNPNLASHGYPYSNAEEKQRAGVSAIVEVATRVYRERAVLVRNTEEVVKHIPVLHGAYMTSWMLLSPTLYMDYGTFSVARLVAALAACAVSPGLACAEIVWYEVAGRTRSYLPEAVVFVPRHDRALLAAHGVEEKSVLATYDVLRKLGDRYAEDALEVMREKIYVRDPVEYQSLPASHQRHAAEIRPTMFVDLSPLKLLRAARNGEAGAARGLENEEPAVSPEARVQITQFLEMLPKRKYTELEIAAFISQLKQDRGAAAPLTTRRVFYPVGFNEGVGLHYVETMHAALQRQGVLVNADYRDCYPRRT